MNYDLSFGDWMDGLTDRYISVINYADILDGLGLFRYDYRNIRKSSYYGEGLIYLEIRDQGLEGNIDWIRLIIDTDDVYRLEGMDILICGEERRIVLKDGEIFLHGEFMRNSMDTKIRDRFMKFYRELYEGIEDELS